MVVVLGTQANEGSTSKDDDAHPFEIYCGKSKQHLGAVGAICGQAQIPPTHPVAVLGAGWCEWSVHTTLAASICSLEGVCDSDDSRPKKCHTCEVALSVGPKWEAVVAVRHAAMERSASNAPTWCAKKTTRETVGRTASNSL